MKIRQNLQIIYISILIILVVTTLAALYDGGYHISGGMIAGIAFASLITSLLPFFISMHLFKKYESNKKEKGYLQVWGSIIYLFCFPVKLWIIISNLVLLINGGSGWAFG
jgi:hypothetical protein